MRIYRVDGKETTNIPDGLTIDANGKAKVNGPQYPHKVECLDTDDETPKWVVVCDNKRKFDQELATIIHGKFCHSDHTEQCGWHYHSWNDTVLDATRVRYLDKANAILNVIRTNTARPAVPIGQAAPSLDEYTFNVATKILGQL